MIIIELKSTDFNGGLNHLGRKALLDTRGYYNYAFLTTISPASDLDIEQALLYATELVASYHNLILPIRFLDRDTEHQITGRTDSYYAFVGQICLGILYVTIKKYTAKTQEIVYTYQYKTDNRNFLRTTNNNYVYDEGWSKQKRNRIKVKNSLKGEGKTK